MKDGGRNDLGRKPTDAEKAMILDRLVESKQLSRDAVDRELERMRKTTAKDVSEIMVPDKFRLTCEQKDQLISELKSRFDNNMVLHENIMWSDVESALEKNPEGLWSLHQLEVTGGEPDVIGEEDGVLIFGDCAIDSPDGRRDIVYDPEAQKYLLGQGLFSVCNGNAVDIAKKFRVELMDEGQYRVLQAKIKMDINTWSWLKTPEGIRKLGLALVGFRPEGNVFIHRYPIMRHFPAGAFRGVVRVSKL